MTSQKQIYEINARIYLHPDSWKVDEFVNEQINALTTKTNKNKTKNHIMGPIKVQIDHLNEMEKS